MKIVNLTQGSKDWHDWRKKGIGSSDACDLFGKAPWNSPERFRRVKTGQEAGFQGNEATARGSRLEPVARLLFQELTGMRVIPVCAVHDDYPWCKASLDGITDDHKTVLEIKCPMKDYVHRKVLTTGTPPHYYMPQIYHLLLVTGADRVLFASYHPDFEGKDRMKIVEVLPNPEIMSAMLEKEKTEWDRIKDHI